MYGFENGAMGMGWGWPGMLLMWIIPILLIVILLRVFSTRSGGPSQKSAREILDTRYAKGEIEREDYLARLGDLKH